LCRKMRTVFDNVGRMRIKMDVETKDKKKIQAVVRALKILEYIAADANNSRLTTISKGLALSKSTTHGLISTMEQMGYVSQDTSTGKYSLGLRIFELGQIFYSSLDLRAIAMPYLQELCKKHQETVHLALLSQGEVIYIDKVDSPRSIGIRSQIGGRNPAYCTGVGKVLLSGLPEASIDLLFQTDKFHQYTENTIVDRELFKQHLQTIRTQGYALDMEEIEIGLRCIAAPIKDYQSSVVAAISISGPSNRILEIRIPELIVDIVAISRRISEQLGYRP
jgi:DNA-binding IclR family transcriptional regulator